MGSRCLLGRHGGCDVRVDDARVSSEHASIHWTGRGWELRDLGSRNGTFVGGRRLAAGERVLLAEGTSFTLGSTSPSLELTLADGRGPTASARHVESGRTRTASGGLLLLGDDESPKVSLVALAGGAWSLEAADAVREAKDREIIVVGSEAWQLDLPASTLATEEEPRGAPGVTRFELRFAVSQDEEYVKVTVIDGARAISLPPRAFHYLLLTLARARMSDEGASPAERGWVDREELCRMLATDEYKLNVDVCRARKQLESSVASGGARIIERRAGSGKLRLGVDAVEIKRL